MAEWIAGEGGWLNGLREEGGWLNGLWGRVVIEFLSGHSDHHMPKKVNSSFSELTFALPVK